MRKLSKNIKSKKRCLDWYLTITSLIVLFFKPLFRFEFSIKCSRKLCKTQNIFLWHFGDLSENRQFATLCTIKKFFFDCNTFLSENAAIPGLIPILIALNIELSPSRYVARKI